MMEVGVVDSTAIICHAVMQEGNKEETHLTQQMQKERITAV